MKQEREKGSIETSQERINRIIDSFARTTEEIFSLDELREKLFSGRQLKMKFGVDVTAPDLHIGHAVNLWMYRRLQEEGHKMIFLIGDFTTQIGDPTGKSITRPIISPEEIQRNSEAFIKQALMVLHDDPNLIEIRRNSEWYNKMSAKELLSLISMVTYNRLIARDMFQQRIKEGKEIYMNEMIYPVLQAYDSVALRADLTIIGSDQLFNEMMGCVFQERFEQKPQVIITTKITPGIDGKEKQSKSLGNYIGLAHPPRDKFGRAMSIPDNLIIDYFRVYTDVPLEEIAKMEESLSSNPMRYKLLLAQKIVERYHGEEVAQYELEWFKRTFSERQVPEDAPQISIGTSPINAFQLLRQCLAPTLSNSEIRRLVAQGAVRIGDQTIEKANEKINLPSEGIKLKVGKKRWFKVVP